MGWGVVDPTLRKAVLLLCGYLRVVVDGKQTEDETTVPVICHSASIVTFSCQIGQCLQGRLIIVLYEHLFRTNLDDIAVSIVRLFINV